MRRVKYFLLCFLLIFPIFLYACKEETAREITCAEIVLAYEEAGYYVCHHTHKEGEEEYCNIAIKKKKEDEYYIYFRFFLTEEAAKTAKEEDEYNLAIWIFALPFGESKWLQSKRYGTIQYSYYDKSLVKPFNKLID